MPQRRLARHPVTRLAVALALLCGVTLGGSGAPPPEPKRSPKLGPAWQEVAYLNFGGATRMFERARSDAEDRSPEWVEATLGLAICLHHRQPDEKRDKDRAAVLYDTVIELTDGNGLQPLALLLRARVADQLDYVDDERDIEKARELYGRILRDWPKSRHIHQAALYRAQDLIFTMDPEKARAGVGEMQAWLAKHPENPLAALQWSLIGQAQMYPLKDDAAALAAFEKALAGGLPQQVRRDSFYWRNARLAEQVGDKEKAISYYARIITEVARSAFAYEAQLRIKKLGGTPPPLPEFFGEKEEKGEEARRP
jgi:hypothetical protein